MERERRWTPPSEGVFQARSQVMTAADVARVTTRIAHEIVERNRGVDGVVLIGLQRGGVWLSRLLAEVVAWLFVIGRLLYVPAYAFAPPGVRPICWLAAQIGIFTILTDLFV